MQNPHGGENSATDGDMDVAYALYLAADVWQEPQYRQVAVDVCACLYKFCFNHQTHVRPTRRVNGMSEGSGSLKPRLQCCNNINSLYTESCES